MVGLQIRVSFPEPLSHGRESYKPHPVATHPGSAGQWHTGSASAEFTQASPFPTYPSIQGPHIRPDDESSAGGAKSTHDANDEHGK